MVGIFPVNKKILGIWTYIWCLLFLFSLVLFGISVYSEFDSSNWKIDGFPKWDAMANLAIALSLFILLAINFWDIILFSSRAGRSLRRLSRSLVAEERIGSLRGARTQIRLIILYGIVNLIVVLLAALVVLIKKETQFFGTTVKDKIATFYSYLSNKEKYHALGAAGALLLVGFLSFCSKALFAIHWKHCLCSYPHRDMGHLACSRPGTTKLLYTHSSFWLLIVSGFMCFITFSFAQNKNSMWLKWMKAGSEEYKWTSPLFQGLLAGILVSLFLIIMIMSSHSIKNKRDYQFAIKKQNLLPRDVKELVETRKAIDLSSVCQQLLLLFWFFAAATIILSEETFKTYMIENGSEIVKKVAALSTGLVALFTIPLFFSQASVKSALNKCNKVDLVGNQRLLRMQTR